MAPRRFTALPDDLLTKPLRTPDAMTAGISDYELRGPLWTRAMRGVYRWGEASGEPAERIADVAALLPDGAAIGGWASLWAQGARELDGRGDLKATRVSRVPRSRATPPQARPPTPPEGLTPILVCVGRNARIRPRPEIDLSRRRLADDDVVEIGGVPYVRAPRSAVDLMSHQPPEVALASLDAAIRGEATSAEAVAHYLARHPRLRARPKLLRVVELADGRTRSRPESVMRWVWVMEAGLPLPLVNRSICDAEGTLLGEPDLLDDEAGLVGEFDGSGHRGIRQHTADNIREEFFENLGLEVVRATSIDLWQRRPELVQRIQAKYARGLARDRSRDGFFVVSLGAP